MNTTWVRFGTGTFRQKCGYVLTKNGYVLVGYVSDEVRFHQLPLEDNIAPIDIYNCKGLASVIIIIIIIIIILFYLFILLILYFFPYRLQVENKV